YVSAAGVSVVVAELLSRQMWEIAPVVAIPVFFAYRGYCHHLTRLEDEDRHHRAVDAGDLGACIVGPDGSVIFWNDAIAGLLACPRETALGRPLQTTMAGLRNGNICETFKLVLADRTPRTVSSVALPAALGGRVVDIRFVTRPEGVMLLWQDVSDRAQAERLR